MRVAALAATLLAATLAIAKPLTDFTSTAISVDQDDALLKTGELTVHVIRTDDLLSDKTPTSERSLILERLTHIVLRIRVDPTEPKLAINDIDIHLPLPSSSFSEQHPIIRPDPEVVSPIQVAPSVAPVAEPRVQAIRVEALRIPMGETNVEGTIMNPAQLAQLADKALPPGLVAAEITIVEDEPASVAILAEPKAGKVAVMSQRSFSVFIEITEVENQAIVHSTTVRVPILRVVLDLAHNGQTKSIKAFSLRPAPTPRPVPLHLPLDVVPDSQSFASHPHPHPHPRMCRKPSLIHRIATYFGYKPPSPHRRFRFRGGRVEGPPSLRPHPEIDIEEVPAFAAPHPDHRGGPPRAQPRPDGRERPHSLHTHPHPHPHHRRPGHGRHLRCRIHYFLRSPLAFLLLLAAKVSLFLGGSVFVVKKLVHKIITSASSGGEGAVRLSDDEVVVEAEKGLLGADEKKEDFFTDEKLGLEEEEGDKEFFLLVEPTV